MFKYLSLVFYGIVLFFVTNFSFADESIRNVSIKTMEKATRFFREEVSSHGGYLWRYNDNLTHFEGEGKTNASTIWVQPPGTPSVGRAFLEAYRVTADKIHLNAARDAGYALVSGQLESGGWYYRIDFNARNAKHYSYRRNIENGVKTLDDASNMSILDDNVTQSALQFLMQLDQILEFKDQRIHQAIQYSLKKLINAQYLNGAWPQRYDQHHNPLQYEVVKAKFPDFWQRSYPIKKYHGYYTLNDNVMGDVIATLLEAYKIYGDKEFLDSATRGGDFLILAQMPEPQPAWAQQYNSQMEPAWARRFEPPAISGRESQAVMSILMKLFRITENKRFLDPLPRAFLWFDRSEVTEGKFARFYELKTNLPLYFTSDYKLTYRDNDLPQHYAFKVGSRITQLKRQYDCLVLKSSKTLDQSNCFRKNKTKRKHLLKTKVQKIIATLDEQGKWMENGELFYPKGKQRKSFSAKVISTQTFIRNMSILTQYIDATKASTVVPSVL